MPVWTAQNIKTAPISIVIDKGRTLIGRSTLSFDVLKDDVLHHQVVEEGFGIPPNGSADTDAIKQSIRKYVQDHLNAWSCTDPLSVEITVEDMTSVPVVSQPTEEQLEVNAFIELIKTYVMEKAVYEKGLTKDSTEFDSAKTAVLDFYAKSAFQGALKPLVPSI